MDKQLTVITNQALLKALVQSTTDIVICLANDFNILLFNEVAEKFYGWKSATVLGQNFLNLCDEKAIYAPIKNNFFEHPSTIEYIQDIHKANGKLYTINWLMTPLMEDVQSVLIVGRNVRLKKNNIAHYLDKIIAVTPGSLYWKDKNGRYLGCNEFMVKTSNLSSVNDIVGKTDYELWPESADKITQNDREVMQTGKMKFLEETVKIHDGTVMYFTGVKMPLKDENEAVIGVIGNSLDITHHKKTELALLDAKDKAEKADKIKTEFIRNMEHDIRTPFNGIWGLAEYLWEHEQDAEKKELLGDISLSAKELLDYCNNILDFSKIESGTLPIIEKKFDVKQLIDSIIAIEKPAAKLKELELILDYPNNIPLNLLGDAHRLQRILINLISNSIKFTETGHVKLTVQLVKLIDDRNAIVLFKVEDTGIGIPADKQNFIYEKFTRLTPANTGAYRGIGLGLRVVKQFTEEMKGEIELESELGQGSEFTCIFPFKLPLLDIK